VNEVIETAYALEDDVGIQLGPVVVNHVDRGVAVPSASAVEELVGTLGPEAAGALEDAADFRRARRSMEAGELARLASDLPLPQVIIPARPVAGLISSDIDEMAGELAGLGAGR
jgi:hypothetical protein